MFSSVLTRKFSSFFHIIGSRIGTCLFRKVISIFGCKYISCARQLSCRAQPGAPAASGNSARQKRARQPRGCAHAGCTHRHAMANPAVAARRRATGGDGAAGRPAAERAQGTSSRGLLGAAPAPASDQRLAGAAGGRRATLGWQPARRARRARRAQAVAGGRGRGRAAPPGTRRCPVVAPAPPPGGRPRRRRPSAGPRLRRRRRVRHGRRDKRDGQRDDVEPCGRRHRG